MKYLGIRLSNSDFSFAILEGSRNSPKVSGSKTLLLPKNYCISDKLDWLLKELECLMKTNSIKGVVVKRTETMVKRSNNLESRIKLEAMPYLAAKNCGIKNITEKVKPTIAKDLGLKGKSKYLSTKLDTTIIRDFHKKTPKIQDAILAAWTLLK